MVRDIFGNPYKTVAISRAWAGGAPAELAQVIYAKNSFERLPELAKALEQSGCTSADLLTHCQAASDHVRGCWAVDALLGKAL